MQLFNSLRWVLIIPAAVAASVVAPLLVSIPFAIGHGWEELTRMMTAWDMAGRPITVAYTVFVVYSASFAALVAAAVTVAPSRKVGVGVVLASTAGLAASAVMLISFISGPPDATVSAVGFYVRGLLEWTSIVLGSVAGLAASQAQQ